MALQVAERAVVGDDLEAVAQRLEAAAGAVAAVRAVADEVAQQRGTRSAPTARRCGCARPPRARPRPRTAARRAATPRRRRRGAAAPTGPRRRPARDDRSSPRRCTHVSAAPSRACRYVDPLAAAVGPLDARDEARHDRLDRGEDPLAVRARLGQRVGEQVEDELLVGLAASRRCPCATATPRAAARAAGRAPWPSPRATRAGDGSPGNSRVDPRDDLRQRGRVRGEQPVHRRLVLGPETRVAPVAVLRRALHRRVVGDVARRLLEVRAQPRALEDLGQDVRRPLARDVRAAELRDRVVAVPEEDRLVELRRPLALLGLVRRAAAPAASRRTRRGTAGAASRGTASSARTARP